MQPCISILLLSQTTIFYAEIDGRDSAHKMSGPGRFTGYRAPRSVTSDNSDDDAQSIPQPRHRAHGDVNADGRMSTTTGQRGTSAAPAQIRGPIAFNNDPVAPTATAPVEGTQTSSRQGSSRFSERTGSAPPSEVIILFYDLSFCDV